LNLASLPVRPHSPKFGSKVWVDERVIIHGGKLKALQVTKSKAPGMYGDGNGLYLQIARGGSKSWIFRYRFKGHTSKAGKPLAREMGLGSFDTFSLTEARERARLQRQLLADGVDPIEAKKKQETAAALEKAQQVPFEACAKEYIRAHRSGWKSAKHADQWASTLETWAYPIIGKLPVGGISTDLVLRILVQPIGPEKGAPTFWEGRTETANRVRGRIETVQDWARAKKLRDHETAAVRKTSAISRLRSRVSRAKTARMPTQNFQRRGGPIEHDCSGQPAKPRRSPTPTLTKP
jgi:hypothetical protein